MPTGILVAVGAAAFEPQILAGVAHPDLHVVRRCVDVADLLATAASRQAGVAVVAVDLRGLDAEVVAQLREDDLSVVGVTVAAASADEAVLRRIGIDVVGSVDDLTSLVELLVETARRPMPPAASDTMLSVRTADPARGERPRRRGRVIAVWGSTGAPGRSVVSLGLSAELARLGAPTLLIDADVYGGAIAAMVGMLDEASGLLAAARAANVGGLQARDLACHAREINPMLRVLTGLPRADRWTEVKSVLLRAVLEAARGLAAFTVVDCGFNLELDEEISYDTAAPRRNGATIEALERADTVIVVGSADPVGLTRLIRGIHDLCVVAPSAAPYVVVNRVRTTLGWSIDEIAATVARATGIHTIHTLPDDRVACDRALVHGQTLTESAPDARITKAMRAIAVELLGDTRVVPTRRGRASRR